MCNGQDNLKPHLHYSKPARWCAEKLQYMTGVSSGEILDICAMIGLLAMMDELMDMLHSDSSYVNVDRYVKLLTIQQTHKVSADDLKAKQLETLKTMRDAFLLSQPEIPF